MPAVILISPLRRCRPNWHRRTSRIGARAQPAAIPKRRDPNQITAASKPDEDQAVTTARTVLQPTVQAAVTLKKYGKSYGNRRPRRPDRFAEGTDPCEQQRQP